MYTIICKECGSNYSSRYSSTKFCSDKCRCKYNKKHRGHEQVCKHCNAVFKSYKKRSCCSHECLTLRRKQAHQASVKKQRSSNPLRKKILKQVIKPKTSLRVVHIKECKQCGSLFGTTKQGGVCFCSVKCRKRNKNKVREFTKERKKIRAIKNGGFDSSISSEKLFKRDNGICYICKCNCNYNDYKIIDSAFVTGDSFPTIEHVVPISKGGTHTWNNVMLACMKCNTNKGTQLINEAEEQLKFFV